MPASGGQTRCEICGEEAIVSVNVRDLEGKSWHLVNYCDAHDPELPVSHETET
jgi:hypothetical protein